MTATRFYQYFIFCHTVNKTIFFVDTAAVFSVLVLQFFRFAFAFKCTVTGNAF